MTTNIALLRGINVSGHHKIKMVELKQLFKNEGLVILDGDSKELKKIFIPQLKEELKNQTSFKKVNETILKLKEYNIHIDETPGIKIGDLKSKCRKLKVEKGLDLVVIDYLQLITTSSNGDNRQQEVSLISRELKAMAKELKIPVVALSQLSRGVESRADKKPMMSDIRESGAIEQDADIIMMLYRPEYYGDNIALSEGAETYEGQTKLIIAKNRNGATGEIEYKFQKEINKFVAITVVE